MQADTSGRVLEMDVLRASSIVLVILVHGLSYVFNGGYTGGWANTVGTATKWALGVLFFVSGAALSLNYSAIRTLSDARRFLGRRLARMYPLYLVAIVMFIAVWLRPLTVAAVVAHVLAIEAWTYPLTGDVVLTMWFVSVIFVFYVIHVLLVAGEASRRSVSVRAGIVFAGLGVYHFLLHMGDVRIVLYFPAFALGVLVGRERRLLSSVARPSLVAAGAVTFAAAAFVLQFVPPVDSSLARLVEAVVTIAGIPVAWQLARWLLAASRGRVTFTAAAYASFGMYLFHRPVLSVLKALWDPVSLLFRYVYFWAVGIVVVFGFGWVAQRAYDGARSRLSPSRVVTAETREAESA